MTLPKLRVLLAVVHHCGFTMVADQIGMSQPAASRAIATLETEVSSRLLARGGS